MSLWIGRRKVSSCSKIWVVGAWGAVEEACNPRWLRQKSCREFEASPGYIMKPHHRKRIKERKKGKKGRRSEEEKKGGKEGGLREREGKAVQSLF